MDGGKKDLLELLLKLTEASDENEQRRILQDAFNAGYVTTAEFDRFIHIMTDKVTDVKELVQSEVRAAKAELDATIVERIDAKFESDLVPAIAKVNEDKRSHFVNFVRARAMMIVAIILTITTLVSLSAAIKNAAEVRDLKNIAKVANDFNDAFNP